MSHQLNPMNRYYYKSIHEHILTVESVTDTVCNYPNQGNGYPPEQQAQVTANIIADHDRRTSPGVTILTPVMPRMEHPGQIEFQIPNESSQVEQAVMLAPTSNLNYSLQGDQLQWKPVPELGDYYNQMTVITTVDTRTTIHQQVFVFPQQFM